jgi:hypothetical protein
MPKPEGSRRSAMAGLREYLGDKVLAFIERMPRLRSHLQKLTYKLAVKLADDGQARRETHLGTVDQQLKAFLPGEAGTAVGLTETPDAMDRRLMGDRIRQWMKHDPFGASRGIVDAVGLGGAHRLPEAERLRLAHSFLAMLDLDAPIKGDKPAVQRPEPPRSGRSRNREQTDRTPANGSSAAAARNGASQRRRPT